MEAKEEKPMETQQVVEKSIPVFTVLKNGAILKNIFVVNSRDFSSPERNINAVCDDDEVEEILLVGRHPDCDILLTHPSISRYHLKIRSVPSRQKLFVTDLSSVHGTWVTDQKVEPDACVEVKEGDVIRIGGSTRMYRLHWIPVSRAYDLDNPFVSPLDASTVMEQEEENKILESENIEVVHQSLANTASGDDEDLHLDVTSEETGSSVPSEDDDAYIMTKEISLPLASPSILTLARDCHTSTKWDLDIVEDPVKKSTSSCVPSKQQSGGYLEGFDCSELEVSAEADGCDVKRDGGLHLNVTSESKESLIPNEDEDLYLAAKETSSLPLPRYYIETDKLQLTEDVQASPELAINLLEANTENSSSGCSPCKEHINGCFKASGCSASELAAAVDSLSLLREISGETEFVTNQVMEASGEPLHMAEIWSHVDNKEIEVSRQVISVSPSSSPQAERLLETFTEDAPGILGSEFQIEVSIETDSENIHQKSNKVNPARDQNEEPGMNIEAEKIFDNGSRSYLFENLEPKTEISICSESSENSYNLSEIGAEGNTDKEVPFPSTLAAETFEDIKPSEELLSYYSEGQENLTHQPHAVKDDALSEIDSSSMGKAASVPLLEASDFSVFELAAEVEILSLHQEVSADIGFVANQVMEESAKPLIEAEIHSHEDNEETEVSRQVIAVSPNSPQTKPSRTGNVQGLLGSEVALEIDCEKLDQKSNGGTKIGSMQASAVYDCLSACYQHLSKINTEDIQSLCSSWQPLPENEVGAPSEIWSEVNPAEDQNQISVMNIETEKIFDEGSSSCLSEDLKQSGTQSFLLTPNQKLETEMTIGSAKSKESYSSSEIEGSGNTDKGSPIPSTLAAAETFEDPKPIVELPFYYTGSQENEASQRQSLRDDVLSEMDSSRRVSTCNIWSRRGKAASVLQLRTNKSQGKQKQIGIQPRAQLHRKQALNVHDDAEKLEPEIFTPDKENLTPNSHMLKRLQDIGDIKDSKSASKLSGKSCLLNNPSSSTLVTSWAFTEPEIFTPDKENLTPNSHMLKRLQELGKIKETKGSSSKATRKPFFDIHVEENVMAEQKTDQHSMSRESKMKRDEPVALKKKAERAPFQPLLEKSSSQSQSYTEAFPTASTRNNISRGIRSSSNLSDGKSKMKWTIVLDTPSLLDKESRKPLHLLQGLKGTHLVVPRTVLRELNEMKRNRSFLFRKRTEIASSAVDWIEECQANTKSWIQIQSPSEETKATAPTPPVTPQSDISAFPFSFQWNNNTPEIDSPTSEDQVLECALRYKTRNSNEKLVVLSNDVTLKIKAMAEGVICETAVEFYESLKNPFSERFMWTDSLPRGRSGSHVDDVVLRERYNTPSVAAKGLKLIFLHNSHYGQIQR